MKKYLFAATALIALSSSANAAPQKFPNWYIGLGAGIAGQPSSQFKTGGTKSTESWDAGSVLSASLGYQPPAFGGFRVEAEYTNHHQDLSGHSNGDADVNVGAMNVYYDFFNSSVITPYIGGGIGYGGFDLGGNNVPGGSNGGSDNSMIYQGMVGLGWEPNSVPNVGFDLGYRYFAPFKELKTTNGSGTKYDFDNHSVEVGAKFRF